MFKPFYIHSQLSYHNNKWDKLMDYSVVARGYSAYIEPTDNPRVVKFKSVICHKKDEFNKRVARQYLGEAPFKEINIRDVAKEIALLKSSCFRAGYGSSHEDQFNWVFKYML